MIRNSVKKKPEEEEEIWRGQEPWCVRMDGEHFDRISSGTIAQS